MLAEATLLRDMFCTLVQSISYETTRLADDDVVRKGFKSKCKVWGMSLFFGRISESTVFRLGLWLAS